MADELTVSAGLSYLNSGVAISHPTATDKVTISANFALRSIYTVPLAGASLPLGGITTAGYVLVENMDATNYVLLGNSGDTLPIQVRAGERQTFRFAPGIVPYVIADTAPVVIDYMLVSD